jgi:malonyl-CoA/methylmalonyl-CoA synthetase
MDPAAWVEEAAAREPGRVLLRTPEGRRLDYGELHAAAARFAAALRHRGVQRGDRVAAQIDKSADAVVLYVACLRMGAVFVPLGAASTPPELEYFLTDAKPRVAVIRPESLDSLGDTLRRAAVPVVETLGVDSDGSLADLSRAVGIRADPAPRFAANAAAADAAAADAVAAIIYTSGTTGRSKGAMLTRGNLASNALALAAAWRFTPDDVLLHSLPLNHVHGLFAAINTALAARASLLLLPRFDAELVLASLPAATVYMGVPTHYTRLLQLPGLSRESTATLRLFVSGSAPLPAETHRAFQARTGQEILERYGMTETLMNTSNPYAGKRLAGSVGLPLPGVEVRVTDLASGAPQHAVDAIGQLEVRGPNVFAGYWQAPDKTRAEFTPDGWFKTGDLGRIDAEGYVFIVGRVKDLVISGGNNVYPKEIETELDALPGVLESAVFGVPHPDFGEAVTAVVVARPDVRLAEADIVAALKARLSGYKIPKRVFVLDELPRNAMGKVQKNRLRETYASLHRTA